MTDKELLVGFLEQSGLVYEKEDNRIRVAQGEGPKNKGYSYFYTAFDFDGKGNLKSVGAYG